MEKKNILCIIGFILAVPLQIILTVIAYIFRITPEAFPTCVAVELIMLFIALVISVIGVVISRKGAKKFKALGIIGIVFSTLGIICVVSFCAMLLYLASGI